MSCPVLHIYSDTQPWNKLGSQKEKKTRMSVLALFFYEPNQIISSERGGEGHSKQKPSLNPSELMKIYSMASLILILDIFRVD